MEIIENQQAEKKQAEKQEIKIPTNRERLQKLYAQKEQTTATLYAINGGIALLEAIIKDEESLKTD